MAVDDDTVDFTLHNPPQRYGADEIPSILAANQSWSLASGESALRYPHDSLLTITNHGDGKVDLSITGLDGSRLPTEHLDFTTEPLKSRPFTIGRIEGNDWQIGYSAALSKKHAEISFENGEVVYTHRGSNATFPFKGAPSTHIENSSSPECGGTTNTGSRKTQQDRAGIFATNIQNEEATWNHIEELFTRHIIPAVAKCSTFTPTAEKKQASGSTLTLAMPTNDGKFVCASVGDSPVYMVARNIETKEIMLTLMMMPDSLQGNKVKMAWAEQHPEYAHFNNIEYLLRYMHSNGKCTEFPNTSALFSNVITQNLMQKYAANQSEYCIPEMRIINPKSDLPPFDPSGQPMYECLGLMACSDGIVAGVAPANSALTYLLNKNPDATAQEMSECVVNAVKPYSGDNITAVMLPTGAKAMVAVADGNGSSPEVAEAIIESIQKFKAAEVSSPAEKPSTSAGNVSGGGGVSGVQQEHDHGIG